MNKTKRQNRTKWNILKELLPSPLWDKSLETRGFLVRMFESMKEHEIIRALEIIENDKNITSKEQINELIKMKIYKLRDGTKVKSLLELDDLSAKVADEVSFLYYINIMKVQTYT